MTLQPPSSKRKDVAILAIHPAPYRDPALRLMIDGFENQLLVIFYSPQDVGHREWGYTGLRSSADVRHLRRDPQQSYIRSAVSLLATLLWTRPRAMVIPGYSRPESLLAVGYCFLSRTPFILSGDTVDPGESGRVLSAIKDIAVASATGYWVSGVAAREYLEESLAIPSDLVAEGAYCLDGDVVREAVDRYGDDRGDIRQKLSVPQEAIVFLSVAKQTPRRRTGLLLEALRLLANEPSAHLILVGSGEEHSELLNRAQDLRGRVTFVGDVPFAELAAYFAAADCYVHAGREPYSTAIEYAAHAGLCVIASYEVGAVRDLEARGIGVLVFRPGDARSLSLRMSEVIAVGGTSSPEVIRIRNSFRSRTPRWAAGELTNLLAGVTGGRRPFKRVASF